MTTPKPRPEELLRWCSSHIAAWADEPEYAQPLTVDIARALQEMLQPSPARGVAALPLGTEVVYRPCGRFPEWERGGPYYFAGMVINVRTGRPSIWIADRWPVTSNGDLTDGFEVEEWDAKPSHAPKPTPQEQMVARVAKRLEEYMEAESTTPQAAVTEEAFHPKFPDQPPWRDGERSRWVGDTKVYRSYADYVDD